jgi:uncharacterized integral membrane protein
MAGRELDAAPSKRERSRQIAMVAFGALAVLFALLNLDEVKVNWLLGTWQTPLIIVIAVSFLLGALAGWLGGRRRA